MTVVEISEPRKNWTREEHILAFNLYCKIPFGSIHIRNPKIIELARLMERSVGAVSYKLANFSRLDPDLKARGIEGMSHGAKGEKDVWDEFYYDSEALAFESERLLAKYSGRTLENLAQIDETDLPSEGKERECIVRIRVNQNFFRSTVLAAYDYRCCVTGLAVPELLVASHIVPWSEDATQRMNPKNGLCLNALHDRAFDRGLMIIDENLTMRFSGRTRSRGADILTSFEGKRITLPSRFKPDLTLLFRHSNKWINS